MDAIAVWMLFVPSLWLEMLIFFCLWGKMSRLSHVIQKRPVATIQEAEKGKLKHHVWQQSANLGDLFFIQDIDHFLFQCLESQHPCHLTTIYIIYIYKRQLLKSLCQAIRQDACSWYEMDLSNVFVQDMFIQKRTGRDSRYDGEDESGDWHEHEDVQPWGHSEDLRSIYAPYIMHNNG